MTIYDYMTILLYDYDFIHLIESAGIWMTEAVNLETDAGMYMKKK